MFGQSKAVRRAEKDQICEGWVKQGKFRTVTAKLRTVKQRRSKAIRGIVRAE